MNQRLSAAWNAAGGFLGLFVIVWLVSVFYERGMPLLLYPALAFTHCGVWFHARDTGARRTRERIVSDLEDEAGDLREMVEAERVVGVRIPGVHKDVSAHAAALVRARDIARGLQPTPLNDFKEKS